MKRKKIEEELAGGDLKTIVKSNYVASSNRSQSDFDWLMEGLNSDRRGRHADYGCH